MINAKVGSTTRGAASSSGKNKKMVVGNERQPNVKVAKAAGVRAQGNNPPLANMPANNSGTFPVKTGTSQGSKLAEKMTVSKKQNTVRANMPANNTTNKNVPMGTTMHPVGQVPTYLRNPSNNRNS